MKFRKLWTATAIFACLAVFLCACGKGADGDAATDMTVSSPWSEAQVFTAPSVPSAPEKPAADSKDEKESKDGKTDTAADADTALQRIEAARAVYGLFLESRPQLDKTDSVEIEQGLVGYRVSNPNLDSMEKLQAYVSGFFSAEITQQLMNIGMYTQYDNKLYALDVGMQISASGEKHVEVTEKTDKSEHYRMTIGTDAEKKTYNFDYEKQADGKWVFTHFESY